MSCAGGVHVAGARIDVMGAPRVTPSKENGEFTIPGLRGAPFEAVFPGDVDRILPPNEIAAIEVYIGFSVPAQFPMAGNSSCAAIVLWS